MKKVTGLTLAGLSLFFCNICIGQHSFTTCSAAFLNRKMVVDQYTSTGKCVLPTTATGKLTLQTVSLSPTASKALIRIPFTIAIRDGATKTLLLLTKGAVKQIDVRQVLTKCRKGDSIVLLTQNNHYAVPHNEILIR